ncbi:MAG TPA: multiprotein bridging factor aMBF1 [Methanocorpusculum sp.]|nr:multiprotein bridging factor aMBF1 [Methanocorpusculum sp.]
MQIEYCELCGTSLTKKGKLVQIEGAKPMRVCDKCAKLGTEVQVSKPASTGFGRTSVLHRGLVHASSTSIPRKRDMFDYMEGDIVEDFSKRIASARQAKGFSQKDLAFVLKMQEGDIKKLERGEREPTEVERKKLEAELDIKLLDRDGGSNVFQSGNVSTTTFGDILQIKRK